MSVSVQSAGRRGGLRVLERYGRYFFVQIGRKGQLAMRERYPGKASEWGRRGGRPRKPTLESEGGGETTKEGGYADPLFNKMPPPSTLHR